MRGAGRQVGWSDSIRRHEVPLQDELVVISTVNHIVLHAEVVAGGERLVARGAGEAADVVDVLAGPHHQVVSRDAALTARAPLHRKPPATTTDFLSRVKIDLGTKDGKKRTR